MYPLLIAISFILHLFAFLWILLLTIRIKRFKEIEAKQIEVQKEIEDLFQAYIIEIKEENEKLLNMIEKSGQPNITRTNPTIPSTESYNNTDASSINMYNKAQHVYQTQKPQKQTTATSKDRSIDYKPPVPVGEDQFEQTLTTQVILLHEKGYEPNEIARKLNKGKTEIELLLKFLKAKSTN